MALIAAIVLGLGAAPAFAATPDAPFSVAATPQDGTAIVSFVAPGNGGAPITNYTVTASPGGDTATGQSSPILMPGLDDGTQYTFTVTADNSFGTSAPSVPSLPVTPMAPPSLVSAPAITGSAVVDSTLTAWAGNWSGTTGFFLYQWFDCTPPSGECSQIAGAISPSYTVSPLDAGDQIAVLITTFNFDAETATDLSTFTPVITSAPGTPVAASPPALSRVASGQPLNASVGAWSGNPSSYTYQWYGCSPSLSWCQVVSPLSSQSSYTPVASNAGEVLEVAVVAQNGFGHSTPVFSSPSAVISFPPPTVSIAFPAAGADYEPSLSASAIDAAYSCTPTAGETISSCTGSVAAGSPIPFSPGSHSLTVTATDADGETTTKTVDYTVGGGPSITLAGPGNGASYPQGASLSATATCAAFDGSALPCELAQSPQPPCPPGTSLIGCSSGTPGVAPTLDTSTLGVHTLTVTATDASGETNTLSVSYTVVAAPPAVSDAVTGAVTVAHLKQSRANWRSARGTSFAFTPSGAAVVTFKFVRVTRGRQAGTRCEAPSLANHRGSPCTLTKTVGSLQRYEPQGADVVPFNGRLGSRTLPAGKYSVTVSAVPIGLSATDVSIVGTLQFTIVR